MSSTLCYIHGLNSSHNSFSYMSKEIGAGASRINYRSYQSLEDSVIQVARQLPKNEPLTLIGHSLGGVIALLIALDKTHDVQKIVTISSPVGGSRFAYWMRWFMAGLPILNDLTPYSSAMQRFATEEVSCPLLSVISTGGSTPFSVEANDSIVTVSSQKALPYGKKVEVYANHFEVLMHPKTIEVVRKFVQSED